MGSISTTASRQSSVFCALKRMSAIAGVLLIHLACYFLVNFHNARRDPRELFDFWTRVDDWIPYIGWTWIFYYFGVLYMSGWAIIVAAKMPDRSLRPTIKAYVFMIVTGNLLQVAFPAHSPWPQNPTFFQRFMHTYISNDPYVCLPSMHVALSVLPAALSRIVLQSQWGRTLSIALASLVLVSTLTLKEHFFLDLVAGMALGLAAYGVYEWQARRGDVRSGARGQF